MTTSTNMCVVNVDVCTSLLMPAAKGLKLVELLQSAKLVELDYANPRSDNQYHLRGDDVRVEYRAVKSSQIQQSGAAGKPRSSRTKVVDKSE